MNATIRNSQFGILAIDGKPLPIEPFVNSSSTEIGRGDLNLWFRYLVSIRLRLLNPAPTQPKDLIFLVQTPFQFNNS